MRDMDPEEWRRTRNRLFLIALCLVLIGLIGGPL